MKSAAPHHLHITLTTHTRGTGEVHTSASPDAAGSHDDVRSSTEGNNCMRISRVASVLALGIVGAVTPTSAALAGTPNSGNPFPANKCTEAPPWLDKCTPAPWAEGIGERHVVTDSLTATPAGGAATGSVTFWCQSQIGFQYHVTLAGLAPNSVYTLRYVTQAEAPGAQIDPTGPTGSLGKVRTDRVGDGSVNGVVPLPAGEYSFAVQVLDGNGVVVLEPTIEQWGPDGPFAPDTNGFGVY